MTTGDKIDGRPARILGELEQRIASAGSAEDRLTAAAELHHKFSFDEVAGGDECLAYEPRCTTSCEQCQTMWIGTKAGEVLRLQLGGASVRRQKAMFQSGVRALAHVHHLGQLLVGLDIGYVVVLDEGLEDYGSAGWQCHPTAALGNHRGHEVPSEPLRYEPGFAIEDPAQPERFMHGITAIRELPGAAGDRGVDAVIFTRAPELLVVRLARDAMTIRGRHPLPGWGRYLTIAGPVGDETLVCVTRSGELREWRCRALRAAPCDPTPMYEDRMNLLPTALATPSGPQRNQFALFLGTSDGLYIRRVRGERPVHVPVTRSAVLSIATVSLPGQGRADPKHYVALGLEDGRLRVLEEQLLFAWLDGKDAPLAHDFRVALGDAVLGLEIMAPRVPTSRFVLAGLRDHRLRLFHVRSRESLLDDVRARWRAAIGEPAVLVRDQLEAQLTALLVNEAALRERTGTGREHALRYLLVDDVLPRWTACLGASDPRIVQRACELARGADDKVLYRLSATMGDIAGGDANALIRISQACLVAMPQRDPQRWRAFVSYHLKRFHDCATRPELAADLPRLQHWSRFVRKFLLLGETFADKRVRIKTLMDRNCATHKYLDALIYAAQLEQQRYDLKWRKVAHRDQQGRAQEIARVEIIDKVAIVITAAAEIVFFDLDGTSLPIFEGGHERPCLTPDRGARSSGAIRTRVARVTRKQGTWVRIALSWASGVKSDQPRLTVFDVQFGNRRVDVDGRHAVTTWPPRADGAEIEIHGLFGLPGADAFLVGLDSSESPLALATWDASETGAHRWVLSELSRGDAQRTGPPAVGSTPVRAVAALELEDAPGCYLAAAGAADGSLRFTVFDAGHEEHEIVASDDGPTLLVHPINDIALTVRRGDPEHYGYVCYAGTETGESVCLRVKVDRKAGTIVARQLWRDLHDSPVIAVRPTKKLEPRSPAMYGDDVVFIVTQDGHIAIHRAARSDVEDDAVSASNNYYFEGMRFDRINLPKGMTSWASPRSRSGFLAAYPDGELLYGELHAPRESNAHAGMLRVTDQIYAKVMQSQVFHGVDDGVDDKVAEDRKLAICAMVRIGGGALRNYVLRKQLGRVAWNAIDEVGLGKVLDEHFAGLSAGIPEERDRIKLVVKTVSSRVLDLSPTEILEHCRPGKAYDRIAVYPRVRRACQYLADYLLDAAVQSQRGAVRVRMSIMHALFRANVLWHAALDEQSGRHITSALRDILITCLRDENRIVCVEALRAVAVVLRNITVLLRRARPEDHPEHHRAIRTSFFPRGLTTMQWLVGTILENFTRYRRHSHPVTWSYNTVLVLMFRLFPGDALGLCEQISQRGLGDHLEAILDRLRGRTVRALRSRIRELWILPLPRQRAQARAEFIDRFADCNISQRLLEYEIATDDSDYIRASGLLHIYRCLALLWKVNHTADITDLPSRWARVAGGPELTGSLAGMTRILDKFVEISRARPEDRVKLLTQVTNLFPDTQSPPEAVRLVLERIVEDWQAIVEPRVPSQGDEVLERRLGAMVAERSSRLVYAVKDDPTRVVTVLRYPGNDTARLEVNRNARLGRELAERYPESFVAVHALDPTSGCALVDSAMVARDFLAELKVMDPNERSAIAQRAAVQLARALRCLHAEGLNHGDLRAENVLVRNAGGTAIFQLGDLRAVPSGIEDSVAALRIPGVLGAAPDGAGKLENWIDLMSLTLFLHEVLTGGKLNPRADRSALADVAAALRVRGDDVSHVIARMIAGEPCKTVEEFEQAIRSDRPEFEHRPLVGRVAAEFDVFISYDSHQSESVAAELDAHLMRRGIMPFFARRDAVPDRWWDVIERALKRSRAFAILVGDDYRIHGRQHEEVQAARPAARSERLPFHVFLLGASFPPEFWQDPVIRLGRDAEAMAKHIARSFQHPISYPGAAPSADPDLAGPGPSGTGGATGPGTAGGEDEGEPG
ncbi:MAG TPA: TIR domain-containing protein [Kofleriaceae bacterium]